MQEFMEINPTDYSYEARGYVYDQGEIRSGVFALCGRLPLTTCRRRAGRRASPISFKVSAQVKVAERFGEHLAFV